MKRKRLKKGKSFTDTVLHVSIEKQDTDTALWLLRRFGTLLACAANNNQVIPLHLACAHG